MKEKKKNKWQYLMVLQEWDEDCGWADTCFYDKSDPKQMKESRDDIKSYRENLPGRYRFISRRVPNDGRIIGA